MPQWLVIGISGVTCGGKSTLSRHLFEYFNGARNAPFWNTPYTVGDVQMVMQDDYFWPVDNHRHQMVDELGVVNYELLSSLDMKQMLADIAQIINGPPADLIEGSSIFEHYAKQYQQQHQQQQQQQQQQQKQKQQQQYNSNYYHMQCNGKHMAGAPSAAYQYQGQQRQQQQQQRHPHQHFNQHPHHQLNHLAQQQHRQHTCPVQQQMDYHMRRGNVVPLAAQLRDKVINVLIIEGFLIFNQPELLQLCNIKFHFHLPYEKCYERRIKRVYDPPDVTGYFELCVWPYYEKNFAEYREAKDITFLNGEIAKDKIFKFVLQRIVHYFEERCDVPTAPSPVACPPQQKRFGMLYMASGGGGSNTNNNNNINSCHMPTNCPMEQ